MMEVADPFALTGVVVTEVLQGLRRDVTRIERLLGLWEVLNPIGFSTYREAAAISRLARSNGFTLTTVDSLIASVALENDASVFSLDKDFHRIAQITGLQLYRPGNHSA
jgi:predicted nucleic acid-binding protein